MLGDDGESSFLPPVHHAPDVNPQPATEIQSPAAPWGRAALLSLLAYFLAAKLGLLLSLPVGFVSPLWPAAGVALLLVLRFGASAGIGIALGSLASNLTAGSDGAAVFAWPLPDTALLPLAVVAVGAALQAICGLWLLRGLLARVPAGPLSLWTSLRLCGRAGPIACLINATLAILVLPSFTELPWSERGPLALIWWLGDALGVIGVMPLALYVLRATDFSRRPWRDATPAIGAVAVTVLSWLITVALGGAETRNVERVQTLRTAEFVHQLQLHFDRTALMLENFRSFYESSEDVSDEAFERFSRPWIEPGSPIHAVAWAPRVTAAERAAFEAGPPGGGPPRPILERDATQPGLHAAKHRTEYWPLTQRIPASTVVMGFDVASEPIRNTVLRQALRQDGPVLSEHLQLTGIGIGDRQVVGRQCDRAQRRVAHLPLLAVECPFERVDRKPQRTATSAVLSGDVPRILAECCAQVVVVDRIERGLRGDVLPRRAGIGESGRHLERFGKTVRQFRGVAALDVVHLQRGDRRDTKLGRHFAIAFRQPRDQAQRRAVGARIGVHQAAGVVDVSLGRCRVESPDAAAADVLLWLALADHGFQREGLVEPGADIGQRVVDTQVVQGLDIDGDRRLEVQIRG